LLLAGVIGWFAPALLLGPRVPVHVAARRDIVQSVVASGRVETLFRVDIAAQVTAVVLDVPVDEGQVVAAGQVLVRLEDEEAHANFEQATAAVRQAEAKLRQLREMSRPVSEETLAQARATLLNAQQNFERVEGLFGRGVVARSQLDEARKAFDVAAAQVRAAELQAVNLRPGGGDELLASASLAQAQAALRSARVRLDYTVIRAPRAGTLIRRSVERGDVAQPGKVLMVLAPAGETWIDVQIDEKNLGLLALGQKALASADAYPRRTFDAELSYINPSVDAQRGTVAVRLRVPVPPDYLRQDMTVSVDIEVARRDGALVVPADCLRDADNAQPWVLKVNDGHARRTPVRLGARSSSLVEILDGLAEGDRVVPSTRADIVAGRRVRAITQ
jgi:HlyD family secretion protein